MYTICVNLPGCLPEMEPYEVETIEEAREALANELTRTDQGDDQASDQFGDVMELAEHIPTEGGSVIFGGYVHQITPTPELNERGEHVSWDGLREELS